MAGNSYIIYRGSEQMVSAVSAKINNESILHTHSTTYGNHKIVLEDPSSALEAVKIIIDYDISGLMPLSKAL